MNFRPGEIVEVRGVMFKIVAVNFEGKIILHPFFKRQKEKTGDMMLRLQSTIPVNEDP